MPTLDEILKEKIDRLDSVPKSMVSAADIAQLNMLKKANTIVSQMDIVDGKIVFSERNIQLIEQLGVELQGVIIDSGYVDALTKYASEFKTQARINNQYFFKVVDGFEPESVYQAVLGQSQRNAITLLSNDAITNQIISPIKDTLLASVTNEASFTDVMANIEEITTNTEASDGLLTRYVKRVAYDAFAVSDRQYTKTVAENLGLEFYKYQGGEVEDTRCFCDERHGNFYHKKEIQDWGAGKGVGKCGFPWQGMNAATNSDTIFSFVGGYNCKHSLVPVITSRVPKQWIERAKNLGYYK